MVSNIIKEVVVIILIDLLSFILNFLKIFLIYMWYKSLIYVLI